jgi:hypothetical protein
MNTKQTTREKLIEAIFDFASDEITKVSDAKKYAMMSEEQLIDELIEIAEYFRESV